MYPRGYTSKFSMDMLGLLSSLTRGYCDVILTSEFERESTRTTGTGNPD